VVQFAERFPNAECVGIDIEPYSVKLAQDLIRDRGLDSRCQARVASVDQLGEEAAYDIATTFLVVHEIDPRLKQAAFAAVAAALKPGGSFLIFDEAYPETDADLQSMPKRFAALAQWFELIWGNKVNTRSELVSLCEGAGLKVAEEIGFSRFHIIVATKA
jgi:cyclopropane fatty-acyl-phospholipid synthase-like methyltransferase